MAYMGLTFLAIGLAAGVLSGLYIALGLFLGAGVGARASEVLPVITLQRLLALFLVAMAVRLWIQAGRLIWS